MWFHIFFWYFARKAKLLEPVRFNQKKNYRKHEKWKKENLVYYQVNCGVFTNLIRLKSHTKLSSDQNIQKHEENLGSKLTNHEMKKFPERSEVWLFSLREALCFLLQCYWFVLKKKKDWHRLFSINMFIGSFSFISIRFK